MIDLNNEEPALFPDQIIIDPHMHFWEILPQPDSPQVPQRFLLPEAINLIDNCGHKITHTVFVECHAMYRTEGPPSLAPVGETEFANGIAAMSASGNYGDCRFAHRIVSSANMLLGEDILPVIEAHRQAAGTRFRGVRYSVAYSEAGLFGFPADPKSQHKMARPEFLSAAKTLAEQALSLDVWCLHTQLPELIYLADTVPNLTIVLDHIGTPVCLSTYASQPELAESEWQDLIATLAQRENVFLKIGGMGMDIRTQIGNTIGENSSEQLTARWQDKIVACIETFSPQRCMFESNYPPDSAAASYGAIWNAFKRVSRQYSKDERDHLFYKTAAEIYDIEIKNQ